MNTRQHTEDSDVERMPPQDVDAELAVLGAMMLDGRAVEDAREHLTAASFYHTPNGLIFDAILRLSDQGNKVDGLTLGNELRRQKQLDEVGGVVHLAKIYSTVATWANIRYHAQIVEEKALQRRIIHLTRDLQQQAYQGAEDARELIGRTELQLLELAGGNSEGGLQAYETILSEMLEQLERAAAHPGQLTGVDTGFTELNELTGGWQKGDLIVLAARPSMGKSSLALSFADTAAEHGAPTALFPLEMSSQQMSQRHVCMKNNVDLHHLRSGRLHDDEWMRLTRGLGRLAQLPLKIDDRSDLSVIDIRTQCRRYQREKGLGLVVIDYLQLMRGHQRTNSREQEIASIARGLKNLAKELGVPIIALSQLSRELEKRINKRPILSDLRESGEIEQAADVVMFIYRPEIYGIKADEKGNSLENVGELILGKQRNGPTGTVDLLWFPEYTRFEELAPGWRNYGEERIEHYDNR